MAQTEGWETGWVNAEAELCRLIYHSRTAGRVTKTDLKSILAASRRNNQELGVTGALSFDNDHFLQILEGRRVNVNRIFAKILGDPRHRDVNIVTFMPIAERLFPAWSMLFIGSDRLTRDTCLRFCGVGSFRPERLTADKAVALVTHFAETTGAPSALPETEEPLHSPI